MPVSVGDDTNRINGVVNLGRAGVSYLTSGEPHLRMVDVPDWLAMGHPKMQFGQTPSCVGTSLASPHPDGLSCLRRGGGGLSPLSKIEHGKIACRGQVRQAG